MSCSIPTSEPRPTFEDHDRVSPEPRYQHGEFPSLQDRSVCPSVSAQVLDWFERVGRYDLVLDYPCEASEEDFEFLVTMADRWWRCAMYRTGMDQYWMIGDVEDMLLELRNNESLSAYAQTRTRLKLCNIVSGRSDLVLYLGEASQWVNKMQDGPTKLEFEIKIDDLRKLFAVPQEQLQAPLLDAHAVPTSRQEVPPPPSKPLKHHGAAPARARRWSMT